MIKSKPYPSFLDVIFEKKRKKKEEMLCDGCGKYKNIRDFDITPTLASNFCKECFFKKKKIMENSNLISELKKIKKDMEKKKNGIPLDKFLKEN